MKCINCNSIINDKEDYNCCCDGNDDCNIYLCEKCDDILEIYNKYFENCNGYLDICKECYEIRMERYKKN